MHCGNRHNPNDRTAGFTLAELLIVIVIIGLLTTILMPTIGAILRQSYAADTAARIKSLDQGAFAFGRNNAQRYPGQMDFDAHSTTDTNNITTYEFTGSQVLAAHLFGLYDDGDPDPYHSLRDGDGDPKEPASDWSPYKPGMLQTVTGENGTKYPFTIVDSFPTYKPICYYMAATGIGQYQFHYAQNEAYTGAPTDNQDRDFYGMLVDPNAPQSLLGGGQDKPAVRDGQFVIISAGIDRNYFTQDDLKSWGT